MIPEERLAELARLADHAAAWRHVWAVEAKSLTTARQGQLAAKEVVLAVPDLLAEVKRLYGKLADANYDMARSAGEVARVTRERDEARAERDAISAGRDRLRRQAQRLNVPMVNKLRRCAADTSSNWDGQITIYPPEARGLTALIDAATDQTAAEDGGKALPRRSPSAQEIRDAIGAWRHHTGDTAPTRHIGGINEHRELA
jgi:hypothetical protein